MSFVIRHFSIALCLLACAASAQSLEHARAGSGIRGYRDTPVQPWSGYRVHDPDRPVPPRVNSGPFVASAPPPADATVLFDGGDLSHFTSNQWRVVDGCLEAAAGNLVSRATFGDCQIHLEWMTPADFEGHLFDRGNNGVLLMGLYEIQIFESFHEKLYPDGQAAAVYGQTPPRVNVCRPPGDWQTFDIIFLAPRFDGEKLVQPARVTVLHNGVLVHHYQEIHGETDHRVLPEYRRRVSTGPLVLAGHNCAVRFRNIWLRPLTDHP